MHKGMVIHAAAFEVAAAGRFMPMLRLHRHTDGTPPEDSWLLDVPCPEDLFSDAEDAIQAALDFAHAVIEGKVPGLRIGTH